MKNVRLWHLLMVLIALFPTLVTATAPAAASHRRSSCPVKGKVHVFNKGRSVYACYSRFRHGKIRLGRSGTVREVHVAGNYAAWAVSGEPASSQGPFGTTDVHLAYVPRSRKIEVGPTGCPPRELSDGNVITSLVLNDYGLLGWVCWTRSGLTEVHKYDGSGPGILDRGINDISLYDLALNERGIVLYWSRPDGPRSAVLSPVNPLG
jgi:hypothetical protein